MRTALQLTMHYVRNYGSALQAYALQRAIESVPGWRCETLDVRPSWRQGGWSMSTSQDAAPSTSSVAQRRRLVERLKNARLSSIVGRAKGALRSRFVIRPWERMFDDFLEHELRLTSRAYRSVEELKESPPKADLYVTGSDQTFNPRFTHGEDFWFWSFLPVAFAGGRKISYAASFAGGCLRDEWRETFEKWLPTYRAVSVRESSGVSVAHGLGVPATHCCDPTLLLGREAWRRFAAKGTHRVRCPYVLCYNLRYAVDPYPLAETVEREVSRKLRLPIVHLQEGPVSCASATGKVLRGVSIYDFVDLFLNASFVMTSSFHGTAFALLSGVPFLTYVNANAQADSRALDLLTTCGAERHAVRVPDMVASAVTADLERFARLPEESERLARFRMESFAWLRNEMRRGDGVTEGGAR